MLLMSVRWTEYTTTNNPPASKAREPQEHLHNDYALPLGTYRLPEMLQATTPLLLVGHGLFLLGD